MKVLCSFVIAVSVFGVSCERHEFEGPEGSRRLHEHGSGHGHGDEHGAGEQHDGHAH